MDGPLATFGIRFRVVDEMPAGVEFALVPDPLPMEFEIDEDLTIRTRVDVDELGRRSAISKVKEPEDDGTKS